MNIIAIDIGNSSIELGLFVGDKVEPVQCIPGEEKARLKQAICEAWIKIPLVTSSSEGKRDGVIVVCSVQPAWTEMIREIAWEALDERIYVIGDDIPVQLESSQVDLKKVGTDRLVAATAAYTMFETAAVIIDIGTAITIDLIDGKGQFEGGVIFPGFELGARALHDHTAQLPRIAVKRPTGPWGKNTQDAMNCGLYYSAVGALEEIIRRFAEVLGAWPQTICTGSGAELVREDCKFIDSFVPHLVVTGIVLTYKGYLEMDRELV
jgi:type III pantothenate kinase